MTSPESKVKPLLVGEANPYGADPYYALYPEPERATGDRLRRLIMRISAAEYLRRFERVNLCPRMWSQSVALARATELRAGPHRVIVLLGAKVSRAFGLGYEPFEFSGGRFLVLPHPSGLCRAWNEPGAFDRARAALVECGALDGGGGGDGDGDGE